MAKPVQIVDEIINHAQTVNASDIHLESKSTGLNIRLRIDGILYDHLVLDATIGHQVLSRIKILAGLDVSERRRPQDGKFKFSFNDIRCSTFPTLYGEKIVLRILYRTGIIRTIHELGMSPFMHEQVVKSLQHPSGLFIIAGPTGSGKTTTLYSLLRLLHTKEKNIVTLEDPIEFTFDDINQTQIHPEIGLTFAEGLRSILRQDPDIILLGEIRDKETAEIAIQATLTGHLVLTTIHAHDSLHAILRLIDMRIPPYFLSATLSGVMSQRLVRLNCVNHVIECTNCIDGFKGRTGLFEYLPMSSQQRQVIVETPTIKALLIQAEKDGMISYAHDTNRKVSLGLTTYAECMRVLGVEIEQKTYKNKNLLYNKKVGDSKKTNLCIV